MLRLSETVCTVHGVQETAKKWAEMHEEVQWSFLKCFGLRSMINLHRQS